MRELRKTRITGQILYGDEVLRCLMCCNDKGLVVYGYLGGKGRIECPCGHEFAVPPPFDAELLLEQTATSPRRVCTSMTYGPLPDAGFFQ